MKIARTSLQVEIQRQPLDTPPVSLSSAWTRPPCVLVPLGHAPCAARFGYISVDPNLSTEAFSRTRHDAILEKTSCPDDGVVLDHKDTFFLTHPVKEH